MRLDTFWASFPQTRLVTPVSSPSLVFLTPLQWKKDPAEKINSFNLVSDQTCFTTNDGR
jgi:hypothetical protein